MDPLDRALRTLNETLQQIEEQLLNGAAESYDMYRAMVQHRSMLQIVIADIKGAQQNDEDPGSDEVAGD